MTTVIVGLNGALQKRFVLPQDQSLIPGNVHRASQIEIGVGGKGQDVAVTLSCLKMAENIQMVQFVGQGVAGDTVYQLLDPILSSSSSSSTTKNKDWNECTVRSKSEMRTCTSIVAHDSTTELVEPGGIIAPGECQTLLEQLTKFVPKDDDHNLIDCLCIMGSMPPGCPDDIYAKIYEIVTAPKTTEPLFCLIDSVVGLDPLFQTIKSHPSRDHPAHTVMLKINASELCRLSGTLKKNAEELGSGISMDQLKGALTAMFERWPQTLSALNAIAITDGSHPAYLVAIQSPPTAATTSRDIAIYQVPVPLVRVDDGGRMPKLYPIGAGDAVAAGTCAAWKWLRRSFATGSGHMRELLWQEKAKISADQEWVASLLISFHFGISCGTASCLHPQNSALHWDDVQHFFMHRPKSVSMATFSMPL